MIQCVFVRFLAGTAARSIDEIYINRNNGNKFCSTKKKPSIVMSAQPTSSTISRLHTKWIHDEYGIYSYFTINKMQLLNFILVIGFAFYMCAEVESILLFCQPMLLVSSMRMIEISVAFVILF